MIYRKIPMFKINFYLRGSEKAKADDVCSVYYQLEIEGRQRDTPCSSKIRLPKKYWRNQCADKKYMWAEDVNNRIDQIRRAYKDIYACLSLQNEVVMYHQLRELYDSDQVSFKCKRNRLFFDVFDEMVADKKAPKIGKPISDGTVRNYGIRKTNLQAFFKSIKQPKPLVSDIRYKHIEKLLGWCPEGWSNGHKAKHAFAINSTLAYAVKKEYIKNNQVGTLEMPADGDTPTKYLLPEMRQRIKNLQVASLVKMVDCCVFLWNTGLSYTDYLSLEEKHIIVTDEGPWLKKCRNKSEIYSLIPILPDAAAVVEKYGSVAKLPRQDLSDFNKLLKVVGDLTGINKDSVGWNLSTSVFRQTFSSIMENELMLEERTIMFMMGHRSRRQLSNYTHVRPERIAWELKQKSVSFVRAS